jgi:ABC-type multidrug transport system fused ATPase/permease subunit
MKTMKEDKRVQCFLNISRISERINHGIKIYLIKYGIITVIALLCIAIVLTNLLWTERLFDISTVAITLASVCLMIITLFKNTYSQEESTQKQINSFKENTEKQIKQFSESTKKQIETINILEEVSKKIDEQIEIQKKFIKGLKEVADLQEETSKIQKESVNVLKEVSEKSDQQITKLAEVVNFSSLQIDSLKQLCEFEGQVLYCAVEQLQNIKSAERKSGEIVNQLKTVNEIAERDKPIATRAREIGKEVGEGFKEMGQDIKKWWKKLWD